MSSHFCLGEERTGRREDGLKYHCEQSNSVSHLHQDYEYATGFIAHHRLLRALLTGTQGTHLYALKTIELLRVSLSEFETLTAFT